MINSLLKHFRRKSDPIKLLHHLVSDTHQLETLVHVGAHLAQERFHYEEHGYKRILWIEGSADIHQRLEHVISQHVGPAEHQTLHALLANVDNAEIDLHAYSNDGMSSSIFSPTAAFSSQWPDVKLTGTKQVASTITLDSLLSSTTFAEDCDVLTVDVQGAELLVLQGARAILSRVKAVICEVSTVRYYDGGVLFHELNDFMNANGFLAMSAPRRHGDMLFMKRKAQLKSAC